MKVGVCSDRGKVRTVNEDSYLDCSEMGVSVFAVADGMGGHNAGEVASDMAIKEVKSNINRLKEENIPFPKFILETLKSANKKIYDKANSSSSYSNMGTTITMLCSDDELGYFGNVGDSRGYLIRGKDIKQITRDHSYVQGLVDRGEITEEEAKTHPKKNVITRALGMNEDVKIDIFDLEIDKGDIVLICTDGLTNMLTEKEILSKIDENIDVKIVCQSLIETANARGGRDNITAMLIKF